jgi:broad specificity phosphatase PhoE
VADKELPNWSIVVTHIDQEALDQPHSDQKMDSRLEVLKQKWANRNPDVAVSVVNHDGDLVCMGRYFEGVVIRINGNDDQVTFLTNDMAKQLGQWLTGSE